MLFNQLALSAPILRAVQEEGYTTPTPIQIQSIPAVLKGGDLLAAAQQVLVKLQALPYQFYKD